MADAAAETKALVDQAALEESEAQLNLLEPLTAEEMHDAQEQCGKDAGPMTVLRTARENRKGRKPGSRNRRTDDAARYLSQFGPDPAVAMMKIIADSEEAMVARSRAIDPYKRQMTYGEARAMRVRCAETMIPYFHGKKPVQVDATIRGIVVHETIGEVKAARGGAIIDGIIGTALREDAGEGDD